MQRGLISERIQLNPFWVLTVFLIIVFATGGSSRDNVAGLILLRPLSIAVLAYGLLKLDSSHWQQHRFLMILSGAILSIPVAHLIPLPFSVWSRLPGRNLLLEIDAVSLHPGGWRPLSLAPDATLNALYSLAVPFAVGTIAVQMNEREQKRLLLVLLVLIGVSAVIGAIQATGVSFYPAGSSSDPAGLFANRNHQGAALALFLPILAVAIYVTRINRVGGPAKGLLLTGVLVSAVVIVLIVVTGSRAALILAFVSSLLVPFIISDGSRRDGELARGVIRLRTTLLATGLIGLVIGGLGLLTVSASRDAAIGRMFQITSDPRYAVWDAVIDALPQLMPWGSGVGSYVKIYQTFEPAATLRPTYSNHAHNEFLEIALTAGIPGILLAVGATVALIIAIRSAICATGPHTLFARLGVVIISLLAFASVTDYPVRTPIIASILALAAVWATSSGNRLNDIVA